jgi:NAD(P)-dependent dehydrogenase (short-subunit alcohol dehydrogenase family)
MTSGIDWAPPNPAPAPADRLAGRRVLITGGASGIGAATARLFAAEGAKVAVLDRQEAAARAVADEIGGVAVAADVSDWDQVQAAVSKAAAALGGLDGLVNAAGILLVGTLLETDVATFRKVVDINLTGLFAVCKAAAPLLLQAPQASIVNLASGVAILPFVGQGAYAASKGGVLTLTRVLARELAPKVRVNSVCPGAVDTPMTQAMNRSNSQKAELAARYALNRTGQPEELAQAILFLTSAASSFVTGIALPVDGGRTFH